MPLNLKSIITPLVESLRPKLKSLVAFHQEEVMHPLKEVASTIKLLLAHVANHLENIQTILSLLTWSSSLVPVLLFSGSVLSDIIDPFFSYGSLRAY
jgi:hypothetical protein